MQLNPKKCKTMSIDFLQYNSYVCQPIFVNGTFIVSVKSFKFLGVHISSVLTCFEHCDYSLNKANRRLYALRGLKRGGVSPSHRVQLPIELSHDLVGD